MAGSGYYKVKFIVKDSGAVVTKGFDSPYFARRFILKLRHSKKLQMVSTENI